MTQHKNVSDETAHIIDEEIRHFIDRNYERSERLLTENIDKLHMMATALLKFETIDASQIDDIMNGKKPQPPADWDEDEDEPGTGAGSEKKEESSPDSPLGGPAGQH